MYILLFSLVFLYISCIGYGWAFFDKKSNHTLGERGLFGLFIAGIVSMSFHLFFPISYFVSLVYVSIGFVLCLYLLYKTAYFKTASPSFLLVALLGIVLTLFYSYYAIIPYDTGLYHLQTIQWHTHSPLSFGLANLHGRLGFNSVWFSITALLGIHTQAYLITNGICFLFIALSLVEYIYSNKKSGNQCFSAQTLLLLIIFLVPLSSLYVGQTMFAGVSNDFPATLFSVYITFLLLSHSKQQWDMIWIFSTLATLIKMSTFPIFAVISILYLWNKNKSGIYILCSATALSIWIARSILLSGCIVYPVQHTCIAMLPWSVTSAQVKEEAAITMSWARAPGSETLVKGFTWIKPWYGKLIHSSFVDYYLWMSLFLVILGASSINLMRVHFIKRLKNVTIPLSISFIGIGYWFVTAPDLRFGVGYFIGLLIIFSYLIIGRDVPLDEHTHSILKKLVTAGLILLFCYLVTFNRNIFSWMLIHGGKIELPAINKTTYRDIKNEKGQIYSIPTMGDQCWNTSTVCAPKKLNGISWKIQNGRYYFSHQK